MYADDRTQLKLDAAERPASRTEEVYTRLRRDILSGTLAPGSKLKFGKLQAELEVSATPLREALTRLTADGWVTSIQQRGFTVAAISLDELQDITRIRCLLEPIALRESIKDGDDVWEAELLASFHRLSKIEERAGSGSYIYDAIWDQWHRHFHDSLLAGCKSVKLLQIRSNLFDLSQRYRFLSAARRIKKRNVLLEHKKLVDTALNRDADRAAYLLEKHIMLTAKHLITVLKQ